MDACCLVTLGYVEVSDDAESTAHRRRDPALYEGTVRRLNKTCTGQDRYLHHLAASILVAVADAI